MPTSISVHELQAEASQVVKRAERGEVFEVMRYSKPVAVLVSIDQYRKIDQSCRSCVTHWSRITGRKLRKASQ